MIYEPETILIWCGANADCPSAFHRPRSRCSRRRPIGANGVGLRPPGCPLPATATRPCLGSGPSRRATGPKSPATSCEDPLFLAVFPTNSAGMSYLCPMVEERRIALGEQCRRFSSISNGANSPLLPRRVLRFETDRHPSR